MSTPVDTLLIHAGELLTARGGSHGVRAAGLEDPELISDGAVALRGGRIAAVGDTTTLLADCAPAETVDVEGRLVTPGFVDSHVHLLHGGSRHAEYDRRIRGLPPSADQPAGIAATMAHTAATSDADLLARARGDLDVMLAHGTTTTEAKTGYGDGIAEELRLLALSSALDHPVTVVPTFLGAHALPPSHAEDREGFLDAVVAAVPEVVGQAAFVDVFCDPLGFTPAECERVLAAAQQAGLARKVHADQTADVGATSLAARYGATSIDHVDFADEDAIAALAQAGSVAVLLPGVAHHLGELTPDRSGTVAKPHLPAQAERLIDSGATVALSTDFNPGTSPTPSMQAVLELAVRLLRLSAPAAWHMATINGAHALGVADTRGSLEPGKAADVVVWDVASHQQVTHRFGTNLVHTVYADGAPVVGRRDP